MKHEQYYQKISFKEQKTVLNITGCKAPCKYTEFKALGTPVKKKMKLFGFGINFVSTDVTVKTEELIYPPTSFVAEFGGALGL